MFAKVRTRFAPSPTGYLHIGGLRTALYSYLYAKQNGGDFILRIEDTDQQRYVTGATESLVAVLRTIGLEADEGVVFSKDDGYTQQGDRGPYIQSQRLVRYQEFAQQLINQGQAYYCFCSSERLEQMRAEQQANNQPPMYDGCCRNLDPEEAKKRVAEGEKHVIRLAVPKNEKIIVDDVVRGRVEFDSNTVDDQVLIKSDGFPTYHLAVVVDDYDMEISHVIRGEEWLSSTPKHVLLYKMFNWDLPAFAHLPLILNKDKSKLSKRQNDVAVEDYLKKGYPKEALINFVALLGWHPSNSDKEIFSLAELVNDFDLTKIQKAGAVFDQEKLNWISSKQILQLDEQVLIDWLIANRPSVNLQLAQRLVQISRSRFSTLADVVSVYDSLSYIAPNKNDLVFKKSTPELATIGLSKVIDLLKNAGPETWQNKDSLQTAIKRVVVAPLTNGDVFWTCRVAISGQTVSPPPDELMFILGQDESLNRLQNALKLLS